LLRKT